MSRTQFLATLVGCSFALGCLSGCSPSGGDNTGPNTNANSNSNTNSNANADTGDSSAPPSGETLTLDFGGGVTMELVRIPAGTFMMGSVRADTFSCEIPENTHVTCGSCEVRCIGTDLGILSVEGDKMHGTVNVEDCDDDGFIDVTFDLMRWSSSS